MTTEMTMLADCHVHLDSYSTVDIAGILRRAHEAGVGLLISAGTTLDSSARSSDLASQFSPIFAGVGIHPMDVSQSMDEDTYYQLKSLAEANKKVVVISEIGLDFIEGAPDRAIQYQSFREQIRLARELKLPIIFHTRDAHEETLRLLKEEQAYQVGGAMHYFQADAATASKCLDMGFYISLAKPLLRLPHLQEVVAQLPLDCLLLETDSYSQPFKEKRKNWTEPSHVRLVAEKLAELKGITLDEVEEATTNNLLSLLATRVEVVRAYTSLGK
ncbi:MAG: TatD family hydrolase [Chloroflexi bacterium]|nr:TatD family hydrolase [Chloroflexota bacterium]